MKHLIMDLGGRFLVGQDIEYLQDNYRELFELLTTLLSGQDGTDPLALRGVQFTDTGITITASEGWIFWQGELYRFIPPPDRKSVV